VECSDPTQARDFDEIELSAVACPSHALCWAWVERIRSGTVLPLNLGSTCAQEEALAQALLRSCDARLQPVTVICNISMRLQHFMQMLRLSICYDIGALQLLKPVLWHSQRSNSCIVQSHELPKSLSMTESAHTISVQICCTVLC